MSLDIRLVSKSANQIVIASQCKIETQNFLSQVEQLLQVFGVDSRSSAWV